MTANSIADHPVGMAYLLGDWATIAGQLESLGDWMTSDLYQACLIFHHQLNARRRPSPGDQLLKDRATKWVWPFTVTVGRDHGPPRYYQTCTSVWFTVFTNNIEGWEVSYVLTGHLSCPACQSESGIWSGFVY